VAASAVQSIDGGLSVLHTASTTAANPASSTAAIVDMTAVLGANDFTDYSRLAMWLFPDASSTALAPFIIFTNSTSAAAGA